MEDLRKLDSLRQHEQEEIFCKTESLRKLVEHNFKQTREYSIHNFLYPIIDLFSSWSLGYDCPNPHCRIKSLDHKTINAILEQNRKADILSDEQLREIKGFEMLLDIAKTVDPKEELLAFVNVHNGIDEAKERTEAILEKALLAQLNYTAPEVEDYFMSFFIVYAAGNLYVRTLANYNTETKCTYNTYAIFRKQPEYVII